MQVLIKYKKLFFIGFTPVLAFILAFAPISGFSTRNMVSVPPRLLDSITLKHLSGSITSSLISMSNDGDYLKNAFDSRYLNLIWQGSIPLDIQSDETVANVILAAGAVNMTFLNKNEIFSFNKIVGMRTPEKGYQESLMYSDGKVIVGLGGGICIVSTLLYNAALETGLKIIERFPHSGPVSYAKPGRDAAVVYGYADIRFKNDSGNAIVINAKVEDNELVITFFGKLKENQKIEIAEENYQELPYLIEEIEDASVPPDQVIVDQKARLGYDVTIVRIFSQNGKVIKKETISHDTMPARNKIIRIPYIPLAIPFDLQPLPGFPAFIPGQTPSPNEYKPDTDPMRIPKSHQPVTGTIKLPDDEKTSVNDDHDPKPVSPPEELPPPVEQPGSSVPPAAVPDGDGLNRSTNDRTIPDVSE